MAIDDLIWTTREEVAAQLLGYLQDTRWPASGEARRPIHDPVRETVAELLAYFATPQQQEALRDLALDPAEEQGVRRVAIGCLQALDATLSADELRALLAEPDLYEGEAPRFQVADLLELARTPEADTLARTYLRNLEPGARVTVLIDLGAREEEGHPLAGWLFQHWLEHDRHVLLEDGAPSHLNRLLALITQHRIETRRVIQEWWRAAPAGDRPEILELLSDEQEEWSLPGPLTAEELEELTRAHTLPVATLLERLGRERLLEELGQAFAAEDESPSTSRCERRMQISQDTFRRLRVLWHWIDGEVDEWIQDQVLRPGVHPDLQWHLLETLWRRNRPLVSTLLAALIRSGNGKAVSSFDRRVAPAPQAEDEAFLRMLFRVECPQKLRYHGLCGLDRLAGAVQDWVEALPELARDPRFDPRLRLRAWGALARRGDAEALQVLISHATIEEDLRVRATAVGIVAEVAPEAAWPVLQEAIRCTGPEYDLRQGGSAFSPLAEEAVLALTQDPNPEALTLLLRTYLRARTYGLESVIAECLGTALDALEGVKSDPPMLFGCWRRNFSWRWESRTIT